MKWYEDEELQLMYIEAKELTGKWERKPGRLFMGEFGDINIVKDMDGNSSMTGLKHSHKLKYIVPLFSQEDLQEMVNEYLDDDTWVRLANTLNQFIHWWDRGNIARGKFDSITKLWLAFVMHELYQKKWNPETKKWENLK